MSTQETLYQEHDGIAIISINRPEKKNTLTNSVIQGIEDGIDRASRAKDVAAVVLRGIGDTLTAGYDLTANRDDWETPNGAPDIEAREGALHPFAVDFGQQLMQVANRPEDGIRVDVRQRLFRGSEHIEPRFAEPVREFVARHPLRLVEGVAAQPARVDTVERRGLVQADERIGIVPVAAGLMAAPAAERVHWNPPNPFNP